MKDKYYPPTDHLKQFHCIHCGVFAKQEWFDLHFATTGWHDSQADVSMCSHCGKLSYWFDGRMIAPDESPVEPSHQDLPDDCASIYLGARSIFSKSPRAAAALLRLCVQLLLPHLGESGKNINEDIKDLVSKGMSPLVQKALDYCRVVGNNAVHPGEIAINDTPEVAQQLFSMINFIVEDRITRPHEIESLYQKLPEETRKQIDSRDRKP